MKDAQCVIAFTGYAGSHISKTAREAVEEFQAMIKDGRIADPYPRAMLIFNEQVMTIYPDTSAQELIAEYNRSFNRGVNDD